MALPIRLREHLSLVIEQGTRLYGFSLSQQDRSQDAGYFARVLHIIELLTPPFHPYRQRVNMIVSMAVGHANDFPLRQTVSLLENFAADLDAGLMASIVDLASAEAMDSLLDTARAYHKKGGKEGSGVLAGVVFEDTIRRLYKKNVVDGRDLTLEPMIAALTKCAVITPVQADNCRAAAKVRTSAAHARWDELNLREIGTVIQFTHQLLSDHFPR